MKRRGGPSTGQLARAEATVAQSTAPPDGNNCARPTPGQIGQWISPVRVMRRARRHRSVVRTCHMSPRECPVRSGGRHGYRSIHRVTPQAQREAVAPHQAPSRWGASASQRTGGPGGHRPSRSPIRRQILGPACGGGSTSGGRVRYHRRGTFRRHIEPLYDGQAVASNRPVQPDLAIFAGTGES
jgi:hypothetical protein